MRQPVGVPVGGELAQKCFHCLIHRHTRPPSQTLPDLLIRKAVSLPVCRTTTAIKYWWKLTVGPSRILLPSPTESICDRVRNRNREEPSGSSLVCCQELSTGD